MSNKRIVWALLISTLLGIVATVAPAQSEPEDAQRRDGRWSTAIVGAWLGTTATGAKFLQTFNADGTFHRSIQGEISTTSPLGSHTLQHGVWRHLGGRRFGATFKDIFYDIHTARLIAIGTGRMTLTLEGRGDAMSAVANV